MDEKDDKMPENSNSGAEKIESKKDEDVELSKSELDVKLDVDENESETIKDVELEEEMKTSYIDYSMSVIVGRALPDVRDGLKPVHRRILYAMNDMGMFHNKPFKKCARIVGEVLGKYHPHGDTAVYDSLVRLAQDFSLRYPLINGHGNFGSVDGDSAAAMRYTEARLRRLSEELLQDLDKKTVPMMPNFDESLSEPIVLPAKAPNLLLNGSSGIAVGMATNIPPHNMTEVIDGTIATIDNPEIEIAELMNHINGPDFPTGGIIQGLSGIKSAFKTGLGKIKINSKIEIDDAGKRIIVTEIPYQVKKADLIKEIADKVKDGVIKGISDIRDESSSEGMRIVIELKRDANPSIVKNQLIKHSRLKITFGINMLALVDGEPKLLGLKEIISEFIKHRKDIVTKRTEYDLKKAKAKMHILEGILIALTNIDTIITLIKKSKTVQEAKEGLMKNYELSEKQAEAILQLRLQKLSSLEQQKIKDDHKNTAELIKELESILASEEKIKNIIKDELKELKERYGDERKSIITAGEDESLEIEDLIKPKDVVITVSHQSYIKRVDTDSYKQQHRGGKGIIAAETKEDDFVEDIFVANTHDYVLFFTSKGNVQWLKVYELPEASRQSKGKAIINLLQLDKDEKISSMIPVKEFKEDTYLAIFTKKGIIKKTDLSAYSKPRKGGIRAINLNEDDEVVDVLMTTGNNQLLVATRKGNACKFDEKDARPLGRVSRGVKAITLKKDDYVVNAIIVDDKKTVLTLTEKGYGKRSRFEDYRLINRGGKGVINIKVTDKNGPVVAVKSVDDLDELMLISKEGKLIRTNTQNINIIGRNTQGVRVMKLNEGDIVVSAAKVIEDDNEKEDNDENKSEIESQNGE